MSHQTSHDLHQPATRQCDRPSESQRHHTSQDSRHSATQTATNQLTLSSLRQLSRHNEPLDNMQRYLDQRQREGAWDGVRYVRGRDHEHGDRRPT